MRWVVVAVVLGFAFCCAVASDNVLVNLTGSVVSDVIDANFVGFSVEVSSALGYFGKDPTNPKKSFSTLMNNLRQPGKPGPNFRIGGNSADESWWNPNHEPKPPGIHYDITSVDLLATKSAISSWSGSVVFDLNFRQPTNPVWAVNHVNAISKYVGWNEQNVLVEIGNEPDLFGENGIRSSNYSYDQYVSEFEIYAKALSSLMPSKRIQGATFCCKGPFNNEIPNYVQREQKVLSTLSFHRYPTTHCNGHTTSLEELLSDKSSIGQAQMVEGWVKASKQVNVLFLLGEANSCSCGGQTGVSDVFGATLWAVDFMFNMAAVNVHRINFHGGPTGYYASIVYPNDSSDVPEVRPLYYALWVFSQVTQDSSAILSAKVQTSNPLIKAWAVRDQNKGVRVVFIHKDLNARGNASVSVNANEIGASATAQVTRVLASSASAKSGLTFAGLTYDGTKDGTPNGKRIYETVKNENGQFRISLPALSIAILSFTSN